ncbi:uncharacterized protein LOC122871577 [Siniperca chuatsi]|uniref:uncharacterized protein LOC122871577 n=1 Tax=Siniperca chuatsi TaxID=119488 RepID=UPI001CE1936D|nr:uncharacterized protein LOC122871577 [Siniperca chuatsi]
MYYIGDEEAMARLTISEKTRPLDWPKQRPYKRKWEAVNPAGIRGPVSFGPDRKMRKVDLSGEQPNQVVLSVTDRNTPEAKEKEAPCVRSFSTGRSRAVGESVRVQQTLPLRIPPEAQEKMDIPMRSPSPAKCSKGTGGESTRVKQTLIKDARLWWTTVVEAQRKPKAQQRPSYKRKLEAVNPAGIRSSPDSLRPDKKIRVDTPEAKEKEAPCVRSFSTGRSRAVGESVRVQQTLPLRIPLEAQEKMDIPMRSPSPAKCSKGTGGESTRVKLTLIKDARLWWTTVVEAQRKSKAQQRPSYKRKLEAVNPAGIRRPVSVGPDRKRRRVDLSGEQPNRVVLSVTDRNTPEAKEKEAPCVRSFSTGRSRAVGESVRVQQTLPLRIPLEAQEKMDIPMRSPSPAKCSKGTGGESTRVKQTLIKDARLWWTTVVEAQRKPKAQQRPSYKRTLEAVNPAGIRSRPDRLCPYKKIRVNTPEAKEKEAPCVRSFSTGRSRAVGESVRVQQTLPLRISPEAQEKMDIPMRSPSPTKCSKGTGGKPTRVKRNLIEGLEAQQRPLNKRKWKAVNPANIRSPDSLHLDRKRRVDLSGEQTNRDDKSLVVIPQRKNRAGRRNRRGKGNPTQGAEECRHPEYPVHDVKKTWRGRRTNEKCELLSPTERRRSFFDKRGKTGRKMDSTPACRRFRPSHQREQNGLHFRRWINPHNMHVTVQSS